jgi:hypothetical protein
MSTNINTAIEDAIKALATDAKEATSAHEAMQYAQAALNLAHTQHIFLSASSLKA